MKQHKEEFLLAVNGINNMPIFFSNWETEPIFLETCITEIFSICKTNALKVKIGKKCPGKNSTGWFLLY